MVAILTGFARSVGGFIGLRIALGMSEAPLFPAALKATDKWFPEKEKAAATSAYIAATQVGLALAPPVSTLLMEYFGWPAMFIIMGVFGFVALLGWLVIYREPEQPPWLHRDELRYITAGQQHRQDTPAVQQAGCRLTNGAGCSAMPRLHLVYGDWQASACNMFSGFISAYDRRPFLRPPGGALRGSV